MRRPLLRSPRLELVLIAVARDWAFCFLYQQNLDCLCDTDAQLVIFSPLADTVLPVVNAVTCQAFIRNCRCLGG